MEPLRTFLAIPLPPSLQRRIAALQGELSASVRGIRWTRPETIHLTLRFFGATDRNDLEKIRACMLSNRLRMPPFQVDLAGLGAFPDQRRPRVLWLGLAPEEPLRTLFEACEAELRRAGLPAEPRGFTPHLTIGRFRERGPDLEQTLAAASGQPLGHLPVDRLVLYESRLRPEGASHIPLFTVPLAQRDDPLNDRTPQEGNDHG